MVRQIASPQSHAVRLAADVRLEKLCFLANRDARPVVQDRDTDHFTIPLRVDRNDATVPQRLNRIANKVEQYLLDLDTVDQHQGQIGWDGKLGANAA